MAENALTPGGLTGTPLPSEPAKPVAKAAPKTIVNPGASHPEDRSARYASAPPAKPTKQMETRRSVPAGDAYNTSGIERAMGAMADKMHKPKARK